MKTIGCGITLATWPVLRYGRGVRPRLRPQTENAIISVSGPGVAQGITDDRERAEHDTQVAARVRKWYQLLQVCGARCLPLQLAQPSLAPVMQGASGSYLPPCAAPQ